MTYRVKLTPRTIKERKRLDPQIRKRVDKVLLSLKLHPKLSGIKKLSGSRHDWRIRVGDYRIIYEVDEESSLITVWRIAHRREVYR
ncbi:MAG TPA: type II toxin-antitoxin system RelE/ParE family toxin [Anaerolineae bacterium]|nr:type II toxin-antitoxin system RelE/ParE family toxin [Anaerolineae bacterium]